MPVTLNHLKVVNDLTLVPDVVAGRDHVDVQVKKIFGQRWSDPKTRGGILPIGDDEIDRVIANNARQSVLDDIPPRPTENVTNKENSHDVEAEIRW
jgi:hypothetical protein